MRRFDCSSLTARQDLGLAINAAANAKAAVPLGATANQVYQLMCSQGYSAKDFSAAYDFLSKKA